MMFALYICIILLDMHMQIIGKEFRAQFSEASEKLDKISKFYCQ